MVLGLLLISIIASKAVAKSNDTLDSTIPSSIVTTIKVETLSINVKPAFSELGKPRALDHYWDRMAQCETKGNWKDKGKWSGGLGIYTSTWIGFGGKEFAPKPELATREQQILIANRISTQGYQTKNEYLTIEQKLSNKPFFRNAVGFSGWGCMKQIGKPILFTRPPFKIYFWRYQIGERSERVKTLQKLIGIRNVDGYYGPLTKKAHKEFVDKNKSLIISEYEKYKS